MDHACTSVHVHHIEKLVCCVALWLGEASARWLDLVCMHLLVRHTYTCWSICTYYALIQIASWVISLGREDALSSQPARNVVTFRVRGRIHDGRMMVRKDWKQVHARKKKEKHTRRRHRHRRRTGRCCLAGAARTSLIASCLMCSVRFNTPAWTRSYNNCIEMIINQIINRSAYNKHI
jgi:hypothetical protein